jgi:hypothetical protein
MFYKIFTLSNGEGLEIVKCGVNVNENRLAILYRKKESDDTGIKNILMVYEVTISKSVHDMKISYM